MWLMKTLSYQLFLIVAVTNYCIRYSLLYLPMPKKYRLFAIVSAVPQNNLFLISPKYRILLDNFCLSCIRYFIIYRLLFTTNYFLKSAICYCFSYCSVWAFLNGFSISGWTNLYAIWYQHYIRLHLLVNYWLLVAITIMLLPNV